MSMQQCVARRRSRPSHSQLGAGDEFLRYFPTAFGQFWQRSQQPIDTRHRLKIVHAPRRFLGSGLFMEDEHVVSGPQTAGKGRKGHSGLLASVLHAAS